ncbi:hypothetical protein ADL01_20775 [Streptomyces sp. NRRL WC-3618]|uniref:GAF domain-containing protein n=1 Tax=Streptomyces sp. NRRL WC-3618 TaxID=1519490 RepID=UPI0006AFFFEC|nr:GAF domain-containing protein [Streptomyces sp. NRRL WC-3618]KOV70574.1 hypothetical protein ADL01_20775 [Streptomyces sp. NRRL WC-3618]
MTRELEITEAFVHLTDTFSPSTDPTVLLHHLVDHSLRLSSADSAGVMLSTARGGLRPMAVSDRRAELTEVFQAQSEQGPCVDAFRSGTPVYAPRLEACSERWPLFVELAARAGFAGAHALPIRVGHHTIGALNLLTEPPLALSDGELRMIQAFARVTAVSLMHWTSTPLEPHEIVTRTQAALSRKAALDTAAGMLAAAGSMSLAEAADALLSYSAGIATRPTDTARALVERTLTPDAVLGRAAEDGVLAGGPGTDSHRPVHLPDRPGAREVEND